MDRSVTDRDSVLQDVQSTGDGIRTRRIAGTEERTAVGSQWERPMRRAAVDQPEQRHQPGPGGLPVEQDVDAALGADGFLQHFVERPDTVGTGEDRVVNRQQLPGLGEQAHNQPHHQPHGRLIQGFISLGVRQRRVVAVPDQRVEQARICPVRRRHVLQKQFNRLADILSQHAGQIRLSLAGLFDGIQQP